MGLRQLFGQVGHGGGGVFQLFAVIQQQQHGPCFQRGQRHFGRRAGGFNAQRQAQAVQQFGGRGRTHQRNEHRVFERCLHTAMRRRAGQARFAATAGAQHRHQPVFGHQGLQARALHVGTYQAREVLGQARCHAARWGCG